MSVLSLHNSKPSCHQLIVPGQKKRREKGNEKVKANFRGKSLNAAGVYKGRSVWSQLEWLLFLLDPMFFEELLQFLEEKSQKERNAQILGLI